MALSKKTKNQRNKSSNIYSNSKSVSSYADKLSSLKDISPVYLNSYASQLKSLYDKIRNSNDFSYSPENDAAYRRFADDYNALSALAIAQNSENAKNLTGGNASSYADDVSSQGLARLKSEGENAKPAFLENAEKSHIENSDLYKSMYQAAADSRNDELDEFSKRAGAWNNQYENALKSYYDERDFDYKKYGENREFWENQYQNELADEKNQKNLELKKYDIYEEIAANKCDEYCEKKNNKGMKNYLNKLVDEGKLTKYMADNLYRKYKYVPPASRSSGGSGRGSNAKGKKKKYDPMENWQPNRKVTQYINLRNRAEDYSVALYQIDELVKMGIIDKDEKLYYVYYYRDKLK